MQFRVAYEVVLRYAWPWDGAGGAVAFVCVAEGTNLQAVQSGSSGPEERDAGPYSSRTESASMQCTQA